MVGAAYLALAQPDLDFGCRVSKVLDIERGLQPDDPATQKLPATEYLNRHIRAHEPHARGSSVRSQRPRNRNSHAISNRAREPIRDSAMRRDGAEFPDRN
jgi:hypothetical protein